LSIYDGTVATGNLLGVFTGQQLPNVVTAQSGTAILIFTSDGSISTSGFSLYWETDAAFPSPPSLSVPILPACNSSELNVEFNTLIPCEWLEDATFQVYSISQQFTVESTDLNCASGQTDHATLTLNRPLQYNCDVIVNLTIQIPDECDVFYEFDVLTTFFYDECPIGAQLTAESPVICSGECTDISLNLPGCFTYDYQWVNDPESSSTTLNVCPTTTTEYTVQVTELETNIQQSFSVTVVVEEAGIITPEQSVCQSGQVIQLQSQTNGQWQGNGVVAGTEVFDPELAGAGEHVIYIQTEHCLDSVLLTVLPIEVPPAFAACEGSAAFQLTSIPTGGVWAGSGVAADGFFNPVASGSFPVSYSVNGCVVNSEVNVAQISGPAALSPVCQSVSPFQIDVTPLGGIWTGSGIVDQYLGIFDPSEAAPGLVSLNYALNGCDEEFSFEVRAMGVIDSLELCPGNAPAVLDPNAQPPGGQWSNAADVVLPAGIFNPGSFNSDTETFAIYTYSSGYLCRDTVHISIVATDIQVEELSFCYDEPSIEIGNDLLGDISPVGGIWSGPGVSGSLNSGFMLTPQDMPIGLNYIYYNANTCTDSVLVVVYGPSLPDAPQIFCSSDEPVILANAVPGGSWSGSGVVDVQLGLFDPSEADEGTYFIYWNNPLGCGDSILVTVEKVVEPSISGISDIYCNADYDVNFTLEPMGGQLIGSLSSLSFNPSELTDGEYTVIYRLTPEHCPVIDDTATFAVYPPLVIEPFTVATNPVCFSETIELNAIVEGGYPDNGLTYLWSNGGANAAENTQLYTETTTVTLTVDDGCSESVSQSIEIVVHPLYNFDAMTSPIECLGEPGSVELTFGTNASYDVTWNGEAGNYQYDGQAGEVLEINIVDENLCRRDTVVTIPAFPAFSYTALVPETLCADETGTIQLTILPAASYDVEWNGVVGNTSFTAPAGTDIQIEITDSYGCTQDTSILLEMFTDFQFFVTNPSILCPGQPAPIEIDFIPTSNYEVLWNGAPGNPNLFVAQAGTSTEVTITDQYGCEKDTIVTVDSYPDFNMDITLPPINCPGEPSEVELSFTPVGIYGIQWNGVTTNATSYVTAAGESVFINIEDNYGCFKDTSVIAPAHPDFSLQITTPSTQCTGQTGTIELNVVPAGSYNTEWNGEGVGENFTYDAQAGSNVQLVVTDFFGCERDTMIPIESYPDFAYTLTNESIVCPGEPAVVEIDYTPSGNYTVLWNGAPGNPNVFNAEAGSLVSISISNQFGCRKDTLLMISSYPIFNVNVVTPETSCPGESATVELFITPSSTYTVEWNGEVGNQSSYITESGSEVSIEVTDEFGCVKDTSVLVEAFPEPVASFSIEQIGTCIPFEESSNITIINNSVNGQTGTWDFGDGQTSSFSPGVDVVHSYAQAGNFNLTLEIWTADSCTATSTQQICILPEEPVFIPDIFSPNEDGKNDTLYVRGKLISRLEFRIYSRWGEVVFEANDVSQGWDGNVRGVPAPSGSYYYTITATVGSATRVEEVGEIVLIR